VIRNGLGQEDIGRRLRHSEEISLLEAQATVESNHVFTTLIHDISLLHNPTDNIYYYNYFFIPQVVKIPGV